MLQDILNVKGVSSIKKDEQQSIKGGRKINKCGRCYEVLWENPVTGNQFCGFPTGNCEGDISFN